MRSEWRGASRWREGLVFPASPVPRIVHGLNAVPAHAMRGNQARNRFAGLLGRTATQFDDLSPASISDRGPGHYAFLDRVESSQVIAPALRRQCIGVA